MADETAQRAWITRVLEFRFPDTAPAGSAATNGPALAVWQQAKDAADEQLGRLYGALRRSGLPVLGKIADDIEQVLEGFRVRLIAALMSFDGATGPEREKARVAALAAVREATARLATDRHVLGADNNPLGMPITIGATLGAALARLQQRLAA